MKKVMTILMAATLFSTAIPAFALSHGGNHDPQDLDCARDCELALKNCAQDTDTIQQKIAKLEAAVRKESAERKTVTVASLQRQLDQAREMLRTLEKGGH